MQGFASKLPALSRIQPANVVWQAKTYLLDVVDHLVPEFREHPHEPFFAVGQYPEMACEHDLAYSSTKRHVFENGLQPAVRRCNELFCTRLVAVLDMARYGPAGHLFGPEAYVFGSAVGARTKSVKAAWGTLCRKTGIRDLHFHDLRHEAGSRFLEAGWPLHEVQYMLGHADIKTTSTYLNVTLPRLHQSMRRFDQSRQACTTLAQTPIAGSSQTVLVSPQKARNTLTN